MTDRDAVEALAKSKAGNWRSFDSFMAGRQLTELPLGHQWAVVYTSNRDSGALTRSNARIIARELAPFVRHGRDIQEASSSHWGCGHVDGYVVRVYTACGRVTRAFTVLAELLNSIEEYPILDELDFSEEEQREASATWAAMRQSERIDYLRHYDAEFHDFADMLGCARGKWPPYGSDGFSPLLGNG